MDRPYRLLEGKLDTQLYVARDISLCRVTSVSRVVRIGAEIDEVRMIESIQCFTTNLYATSFTQRKILRDRQIHALERLVT